MNKILIAVDDTKGTKAIFDKMMNICKCMNPDEIILLYVEKLEGSSLMDDMLGEAELSTLREELEGTEYKRNPDNKAEKILGYYKNLLQNRPPAPEVRTVVRTGNRQRRLSTAQKKKALTLIIIRTRANRIGRFFIGSVSREVVNEAPVPVLVVR